MWGNLRGLSSETFLFQGRPVQDWSQRKTQEEGSVANNPGGLWRLERPMPSSLGGDELGKQILENEGPSVTWLSMDMGGYFTA